MPRINKTAGLFLLAMLGAGKLEAAETYNYCDKKIFSDAPTVLMLIDRSASYDNEDMKRLSNALEVILPKIGEKPGTRLIIEEFSDYAKTRTDAFDKCIPGCPPSSYFKFYDGCYKNGVADDVQSFKAGFVRFFNKQKLQGLRAGKDSTSLAEFLREIASKESETPKPDELIIFSDFLEFTNYGKEKISFYSAKPQEMEKYFKYLEADRISKKWAGVKVVGFGLQKELGYSNPKDPTGKGKFDDNQWRNIYSFWYNYFDKFGASKIGISQDYPGAAAYVPPDKEAPPAQPATPVR